jgi:hypothetical protein
MTRKVVAWLSAGVGIAVVGLVLVRGASSERKAAPAVGEGSGAVVPGSGAVTAPAAGPGPGRGRLEPLPAVPPPRRVHGEVPDLITSSNAAGYDAIKLLDSGRMTIDEIFEAESRDDPWALEIERLIGPSLTEDLRRVAPGLKARAECRTSACRVSVVVPGGWDPEELSVFIRTVPLGEATQAWESNANGTHSVGATVLLGTDLRQNYEAFQTTMRSRFQRQLSSPRE